MILAIVSFASEQKSEFAEWFRFLAGWLWFRLRSGLQKPNAPLWPKSGAERRGWRLRHDTRRLWRISDVIFLYFLGFRRWKDEEQKCSRNRKIGWESIREITKMNTNSTKDTLPRATKVTARYNECPCQPRTNNFIPLGSGIACLRPCAESALNGGATKETQRIRRF